LCTGYSCVFVLSMLSLTSYSVNMPISSLQA